MEMGVMDESMKILRSCYCPTRMPEETMKDVLSFFEGEELDAFGIATFGPVDLHPESPSYGNITTTPKLAWRNFPLMKSMQDALNRLLFDLVQHAAPSLTPV